MHSPEERYRKDPSIVSREVAGETILVPIRNDVGDMDSIYTLNETAARTWALIDGERTLAQIGEQLVEEFEVNPEQASQDLRELIAQLEAIGAVVKV